MADNKMNSPDQERNLGGKTGHEGQQAPGRNLNDEQSGGQRGSDRGIEPKRGSDLNKEGGGGRESDSRENP